MAQGPMHKQTAIGLPTEVPVKPAPDGVKDTSRSNSPARNRGRNVNVEQGKKGN